MAPHFAPCGVEVTVAHFGDGEGLGPQLVERGIRVVRISDRRPDARIRRCRELVREQRPDLVHTTLFQADQVGRLAARSAGVPVVSSLVNLAYGPEQQQASGIPAWKLTGARLVDTATVRFVRRFHAISETVATVMGSRLHIPSSRIDVVPRGREPDALGLRSTARRDATRRSLDLDPATPMLLAAARHEPQKGLETLVAAMEFVRAARPGAVLVVAGREGNSTELLRRTVASAGLDDSVRLLGARRDVPDLMVAADVFAFASRWEGLGGVLIEAMALEVPIVSSDLPVARETLVDDDGRPLARFVEVDDPRAFAAACLDALADPGDAPERGRERFLRHYTAEAATRGLVRFYERSLA